MWTKLDYIHMNPVQSGIVAKASDYVYSSASNYIDDKGLIDIVRADIQIVDVIKSSSFEKYISL